MALNTPIQAPWGSHSPAPWPRALVQPSPELPACLRAAVGVQLPSCLPCPAPCPRALEQGYDAQSGPLISPGTWLKAAASAPGTAQCIGRVCIPLFFTGGKFSNRALKQLIFNSVLSPSYFPFMEHCIVVCHLKTDLNKATLLSNLQEN